MIKVETTSRLPAGYQEVEYIQSSGTQYINTGFKPNNNTRTVMDLELVSSDGIPFIFGVWSGSVKQAYSVYWWTTQHNKWGVDYGTQRQVIEQTVWAERLTVDLNKNVITVKNVSYTLTPTTFTAPNTLTLLALNSSSELEGYYAKAKLYGCKIYDNGTLIRDYVPCYRVSDGAAGLFDIANNVFYSNAGSGTFAVGKNIGSSVIVVTSGGVIPKKWALRRRILATEIKAAQQNLTIQLFGEFYQNSTSYAEMVVDGRTYNTAQIITAPKGTVVTLRIKVNSWYNNLEYDSQIIVNGSVVARATVSGQLLTYNYTVNEDCTIESYIHYTGWGSNSYAFRVTT